MKIFLSFLQSEIQHQIAAYGFWAYYIKNGIKEGGHEWLECEEIDWAIGLVPQTKQELGQWKANAWGKSIEYLKKNNVDIFLSYLYPHQIDEQAINEIKKMGIFCVNFFCDNVRMFKTAPEEFKVFDLNWVPEYKAAGYYEKARFPFIRLPMPMWVDPKYRTIAQIENKKVSFIGSKDIQRQLLFEDFIKKEQNINIDIYGNAWKNESISSNPAMFSSFEVMKNQILFIKQYGLYAFLNKLKSRSYNPELSDSLKLFVKGKLDFEDYIKITRESNIIIGINRYPSFNYPLNQANTYSRLRDLEAPMLGACYLTEWTAGIDELYDIGEDIETYRTVNELIDKCQYLLKSASKRALLRKNAQNKSLKEHSIPNILQKLITYL